MSHACLIWNKFFLFSPLSPESFASVDADSTSCITSISWHLWSDWPVESKLCVFFSRICQKKNRLRLHAFAFHHYLPPAKRVGMWSPGQGTQLCRLDDAHCSHGVYVVGSLCKQSGSVVSDGCKKSAAWSNVWISPLVTNLVCDDRCSVCTHVLRYSIECLNHSKWSRKSTSVKNVSHYWLFKVFEYKFDLISYSYILIIKYESIKVLC